MILQTTLNKQQLLQSIGGGKLVKDYPHIPGIDFAGVVEASEDPNFTKGDKVILTGWRVGEIYYGGYAQYAKVKGKFLVKTPDPVGFSSMAQNPARVSSLSAKATATETGAVGTSSDGPSGE